MKVALGIEYDGYNYHGWQKQQKVIGVANLLEKAVNFVANESCEVFCAGRTDAGVHATGQVVHFETTAQRQEKSWLFGINANLPDDISVKWAQIVRQDFHARFSALSRRYRYIISNTNTPSAILNKGITYFPYKLDIDLMLQASRFLLGEHDFTSFRSSQCQSTTPFRNIHFVDIIQIKDYIVVDIQANAFLHHMVRNIVGSLLAVGTSAKPVNWVQILLQQKNRNLAAPTAKAHGLYLVDVEYPKEFFIPKTNLGPLFL